KRALLHLQDFIRHLPDALSNRETVHRFMLERFQDEQVEGALQKFGGFVFGHNASLDVLGESGVKSFHLERLGETKNEATLRLQWVCRWRTAGIGPAPQKRRATQK